MKCLSALSLIIYFTVVGGYFFPVRRKSLLQMASINKLHKSKKSEIVTTFLTLEPQSVISKGWIPMVVTDQVDINYPQKVEVLGRSYVVWKDPKANNKAQGWTVMLDSCPHRFAPLSEGRIDKTTGCLECPYHGWQFESSAGSCQRIPQVIGDSAPLLAAKTTTAKTFPVHLTNGILWAELALEGLNQSQSVKLPEEIFPELNDPERSLYSRTLPYSFDFAVENFMDPAHIPFAHHKLQGTRDDAIGITVDILTDISNPTHCEFNFTDRSMKTHREGTISFVSPIYYRAIANRRDNKKPIFSLIILTVPVSPGQCRIFISAKVQLAASFRNWFPVWLMHGFSTNFLNSDVWLYDQEKFIRNRLNTFEEKAKDYDDPLLGRRAMTSHEQGLPKYALMTESDRGITAWRKWWKRHMASSPIFGPSSELSPLSKKDKFDHFHYHTQDCKHCLQSLKRAKKLKFWNALLSLSIVAFSKNPYLKLVGLGTFWLVHRYIRIVERMTEGPDPWERISAAQGNE